MCSARSPSALSTSGDVPRSSRSSAAARRLCSAAANSGSECSRNSGCFSISSRIVRVSDAGRRQRAPASDRARSPSGWRRGERAAPPARFAPQHRLVVERSVAGCGDAGRVRGWDSRRASGTTRRARDRRARRRCPGASVRRTRIPPSRASATPDRPSPRHGRCWRECS